VYLRLEMRCPLALDARSAISWLSGRAPRPTAERSRPAERSDAQRRASWVRYGVGGSQGVAAYVGQPRRLSSSNIDAMKSCPRPADQCLMRAGKAEQAMGATGLVGSRRRLRRRVLRVVQTQFDAGCAVMQLSRRWEAAEPNEQSLRGYRVRDHDADQRAPKAL
jgi:hypothetical protein